MCSLLDTYKSGNEDNKMVRGIVNVGWPEVPLPSLATRLLEGRCLLPYRSNI